MSVPVPEGVKIELASAGRETLGELLDRWQEVLDPASVKALLGNPHCDEGLVRRIYRDRRLIALYEVRVALVRQRALPLPLALQLVPGLYWRDLVAVAQETRIRPQIRRSADLRLVDRLPALAVGERMNLARRASPRLIQALGRDPNARVCAALLENPRLTEGQVLPWVSNESTSSVVLAAVAKNRRWGCRYPIRVALCRNPSTPVTVALSLLPLLKRRDLEAVGSDGRLASPVRRRADLLSGR